MLATRSHSHAPSALSLSSPPKMGAADPPKVAVKEVAGPTYMDREGDLRLEVGREKVAFIVCSRTLARASPVFKAMLFGKFLEAKPAKGDWVVRLPADHIEGLRILLNIIHNHFDAVPPRPGDMLFSTFKGLAVVADKYDMTSFTRPWAKNWQADLRRADDAVAVNCGQLIWISWVFGFEDHFKQTVDYLTRASCVSKDETSQKSQNSVEVFVKGNKSANKYTIKEDDQLRSVGILGRIVTTRNTTIQSVYTVLQDRVDSLLSNKTLICSSKCKYSECKKICPTWAIGGLIRAYKDAGLYPVPTTPRPGDSINHLQSMTAKIFASEHFTPTTDLGRGCPGCGKCNPAESLKTELEKIFAGVPMAWTQEHVQHLEAQARKTGLGL